GQPQGRRVHADAPQFTLPLTTHDSVHPDERFCRRTGTWKPARDWEIMKDTTIPWAKSKTRAASVRCTSEWTTTLVLRLAVDMQKLPVVCAVSRECKAFEFSQNSFCRLHFISYSLNTMYAYESGTVYGR
uniref:Tub domain-containing protein n=1 Tax=Macrostomum lignano TaxID=282301 RepID=A0A1I8FM82_9PLAT